MIFLLHGSDVVSSRKKLEELKGKYPPSGMIMLSGRDIDYSQFPMLFSTVSMFNEKRVVVVEEKIDNRQFDLKAVSNSEVDLIIWVSTSLRSNDGLISEIVKLSGKVEHFDEKPDLSVFPFLDAVGRRQRVLALREYLKLKEEGQNPIYLVTMLVWQFRQIIVPELASGFVKKKVELFRSNFSFDELRKIYYLLLNIDLQLKTGEGVSEILVEQFVFKVTK